MKMTRQHFQALADMTAEIIIEINATASQTDKIMKEVMRVCKSSNSNFNEDIFDNWVQNILIRNS